MRDRKPTGQDSATGPSKEPWDPAGDASKAAMNAAMELARQAFDNGEYPVGAVVVRDGVIVGKGRNTVNEHNDPSAHAEICEIRSACQHQGRHKLSECVLYTTLYPCPMCEATIIEAGISQVVYGGDTFRWVRQVKFGDAALHLHGPVEPAGRALFRERLVENGRNDILDLEP